MHSFFLSVLRSCSKKFIYFEKATKFPKHLLKIYIFAKTTFSLRLGFLWDFVHVSEPFSWFQSREIFPKAHETEANPIFSTLPAFLGSSPRFCIKNKKSKVAIHLEKCQIRLRDIFKLCGLLRKFELYLGIRLFEVKYF